MHVVDLDGAFTGIPANLKHVAAIVKAAGVPVELGGGMRSREAVARAFEIGVSRVILGTKAAESLDFVAEMAMAFGRERIAVGIDARNGIVAVKGWTESGKVQALDLIAQAEAAGAGTIIYTDIATDGMLEGPNFEELDAVLAATRCDVIASGGVSSEEDLDNLARRPALHGAIIGKALYDGKVDLAKVARRLRLAES
ncbi:MAG: HisA/HisF-related TIM barrel protein [Verrucomicrobiia bacterium]